MRATALSGEPAQPASTRNLRVSEIRDCYKNGTPVLIDTEAGYRKAGLISVREEGDFLAVEYRLDDGTDGSERYVLDAPFTNMAVEKLQP